MGKKYVLALDQGTSSSRSILFDRNGVAIAKDQKDLKQIYPKPGWVEHDAEVILKDQIVTAKNVLEKAGVQQSEINSIGITNQRETAVLWNNKTGRPVYNAIVWQDRRTAKICDDLRSKGLADEINNKTGLVLDAYFSATKIMWMFDHISGLRELAQKGDLCFGTIDSWLLWNLTNGQVHATDPSNASRTMLYNISTLKWDAELLERFDIPMSILPEVKDSSDNFGSTSFLGGEIPINGIAGDQQAALFGQTCFEKASVKNTYGTGCFLLMNTGNEVVKSNHGLLSTVAWRIKGKTNYALEGSVFNAGSSVAWLRDGLGFFESSEESEKLSNSVSTTNGVMVVPAFTGLGAPYWDMNARGTILGLTRDSTKAHITRATLESIAFQCSDVLRAMEKDLGMNITSLKVDGGATENNFLMQFQSDLLQIEIERTVNNEATALGAAFLAGLQTGFYAMENLMHQKQTNRVFQPAISKQKAESLIKLWNKAVERSFNWV